MGDALITRRRPQINYELKTEIYQTNKLWTVPKAKGQKFSVRIFGGGSSGGKHIVASQYCGRAGSGGFMNNADLVLPQGSTVQITIGEGGIPENQNTTAGLLAKSGGVTSFGNHLAANGGTISFGGSGGGVYVEYQSSVSTRESYGGLGYQFGGGGGGWHLGFASGGNSGCYGGGGGACRVNSSFGISGGNSYNYQYNSSNGQWFVDEGEVFGGNGGGLQGDPVDGTNTDSNSYLKKNNLSGFGLAGSSSTATDTDSRRYTIYGGGGGYGGNGGNICGGGGGYGADGGDGYIVNSSYGKLSSVYGGGGGGYGKSGKGGNATDKGPGGGGGYGPGGDGGLDGIRGGGGGYNANGGNGICIIQYYAEK